jgi:hypothetical protein
VSVNKYRPHLYIVPEDDRNRQIADGFLLHHAVAETRVRVMPPPGGWGRVRDTFMKEYVPLLRQYEYANVVLLIDFDGSPEERRNEFKSRIPGEFQDRVFVIGPLREAEPLKRAINISYEDIGRPLADDCHADTVDVWGHDDLRHNEEERLRLVEIVKPFLFN